MITSLQVVAQWNPIDLPSIMTGYCPCFLDNCVELDGKALLLRTQHTQVTDWKC